MMKSLLVCVFWPAWEWGPAGKPSLQYLSSSFADPNVRRDNRRMRDLVASEWYQSLWPDVRLVKSGEYVFTNNHAGGREGRAFASLTGGRGDRELIDDPHSTETAESPDELKTAIRIMRESVPLRVNDPVRSAIVLIMQRLHHEDASAIALEHGWQHLMLPMEFEVERKCRTIIGFEDWRTTEGELLFPERFPREIVERDRKFIGSHAVAGQWQQRPTPRAGRIFKREWFAGKRKPALPLGSQIVRGWDFGGTESEKASATAGVKLARTPEGEIIVCHSLVDRIEGAEVRKLVKATAEADGVDVFISLPQDPGQAGKTQALDYVKLLIGYKVHKSPESGDKATRATVFAAQAEAGNVYILEKPDGGNEWIEPYLEELFAFPGGAHGDQVDATSRAMARLVDLLGVGKEEPVSIVQVSTVGSFDPMTR